MLRNYLVTGFRALTKNRAYAAINIVGLAIGMAACLMILLYVRYETSFDSFIPGVEHAYQFQDKAVEVQGDLANDSQNSPYAAMPALRKDFPEIDKLAYMTIGRPVILKDGQPVFDLMAAASPQFFEIFRLPFIHGDPKTALRDPGSIAMSQTAARKYFGTDDAVGRTLQIIEQGKTSTLRVSAVFQDLPRNSHQEFTMVRMFDPDTYFGEDKGAITNWGWHAGWIYLTLPPGVDPRAIEARLPAWQERNVPKDNIGGELRRQDDNFVYRLQPLTGVHLGKVQEGAASPGNDRTTIVTFATVALLVLGMACVNFTNLATARGSQRAREVALRKVLGATRAQIIAQFLTEAVLVAALAMILALALSELALPWLARFLDADLKLHYIGHDGVLPPVIALTLIVGIAAGAYPAFRLSAFMPGRVLKANRSAATEGSGVLRGILVVGQFAVSIALIVCTLVIYGQTVYAKHVDPGFHRDGLLQIANMQRTQVRPLAKTLEDAIRRVPGVVAAAQTMIGVESDNRSNNSVLLPGQAHSFNIGNYAVEPGFFETVGLPLLAGRTFSERIALDDGSLTSHTDDASQQAMVARGVNVVVNRSAVKRLGFASPADAIGKQIGMSLVDSKFGLVQSTIVGVVGDARWRSVHEPVEPIVYYQDLNRYTYLEVRYATGNPAAVRDAIEHVWRQLVPQVPFTADFGDARAARQYKADDARAVLFAAFAMLSVIVGCLGLFGLAAFTAERRTKEIGIRKVLGARTRDIVRLLVWQFTRPVLIANLIAWPAAWWLMRDWLNRFDARITLGPSPFLLAGGLALVIAVVTIGGHALRVARANPIHALRYE
ncbi:ABC transporter permease [Sphingomonas nostoxanthinifaciens]|uniref:ABC transporter permease n=1 Tax=Sphingomonas nostoxanthinifaciens TaxID=2872652 RepID=UPI001CC1F290|nr:ABC transporter permease [Sphingomonas nostoxanthinifaciens]UAK24695.1 ABC transporter permease [Sphingomonas nostoxanthinifaciens]